MTTKFGPNKQETLFSQNAFRYLEPCRRDHEFDGRTEEQTEPSLAMARSNGPR